MVFLFGLELVDGCIGLAGIQTNFQICGGVNFFAINFQGGIRHAHHQFTQNKAIDVNAVSDQFASG